MPVGSGPTRILMMGYATDTLANDSVGERLCLQDVRGVYPIHARGVPHFDGEGSGNNSGSFRKGLTV